MGVAGGAATSVCVSRATLRASSPCLSGRAGSTVCATGHRFAPSASRRGGSRVAPPGATGVATVAILAVPSGSMLTVIADLEAARPGRRTDALHDAAVTLGGWIAAGALEQAEVEEALYGAALSKRACA